MPLWKRRQEPEPESGPGPSGSSGQSVVGTLPCSERDCPNQTGEACGYVDRRGRVCGTAWCPDHQQLLGGVVYCRRHAGVMRVLSGSERAIMPDLENRAPSLVTWVARDVENVIQEIVTSYKEQLGTDRLMSDPTQLVFLGPERARVWERAWKLADHTGWSMRVSLEVDELHDTEVAVRVGRNVVARMTPPWIESRLRGEQCPPDVDAAQRADFYRAITAAVASAIDEEIRLRG
jgi:hypothetical protein